MPTLQWLDKDDALKAAEAAPFRLLEAAAKLSAGDPDRQYAHSRRQPCRAEISASHLCRAEQVHLHRPPYNVSVRSGTPLTVDRRAFTNWWTTL